MLFSEHARVLGKLQPLKGVLLELPADKTVTDEHDGEPVESEPPGEEAGEQ